MVFSFTVQQPQQNGLIECNLLFALPQCFTEVSIQHKSGIQTAYTDLYVAYKGQLWLKWRAYSIIYFGDPTTQITKLMLIMRLRSRHQKRRTVIFFSSIFPCGDQLAVLYRCHSRRRICLLPSMQQQVTQCHEICMDGYIQPGLYAHFFTW
jgi:hypothetical protein